VLQDFVGYYVFVLKVEKIVRQSYLVAIHGSVDAARVENSTFME